MSKKLLLLSGGMKSVELGYDMHAEGIAFDPVFFHSLNGTSPNERRAASYHANALGLDLKIVDISGLSISAGPRSFSPLFAFPEFTYSSAPGRLPLLLSLGGYVAEQGSYSSIVIGLDGSQVGTMPPGFLEAWNGMLALSGGIPVEAPLVNAKGTENSTRSVRFDLSRTWSCLNGRDRPCGRCTKCHLRHELLGEGPDDDEDELLIA
jgi:7-cyano-7-deazaguanine synthase